MTPVYIRNQTWQCIRVFSLQSLSVYSLWEQLLLFNIIIIRSQPHYLKGFEIMYVMNWIEYQSQTARSCLQRSGTGPCWGTHVWRATKTSLLHWRFTRATVDFMILRRWGGWNNRFNRADPEPDGQIHLPLLFWFNVTALINLVDYI